MSPGTLSLCAAIGFVLGAIPFSWVVARLFGGLDIRAVGSGNVGATNVARSLGYGPGLFALLLDAAKGAAAVLVARALTGGGGGGGMAELLAGGLAVLGHNFSPFLGFRGGKGVATGAGVFAALAPGALLVAAGVFLAVVLVFRLVSLGSVLATLAVAPAVVLIYGDSRLAVLALLVAVLVVARHRTNLERIARGSEPRLGQDGRT